MTSMPANLDDHKTAFNSVGWFIPPYLSMWFLHSIKAAIESAPGFDQTSLGTVLSYAYSPEHLAAMVSERYPATPCIQDYSQIIGEAVEAHFMGLDHVAATGLMPVVEGAARRLADSRSQTGSTRIDALLLRLTRECKDEVVARNIGAVDELIAMLDSFATYVERFFYEQTRDYSLNDGTNRHGALHGTYGDKDYGSPINFYKTISAVDFLCMISALRANVSWLAPNPTAKSAELAKHYGQCASLRGQRPA